MRAANSYEMNPRQLRALVMLLVLLPLIPTVFVLRFLVEEIFNERSESRERIKPVYLKFLATSSATLAAGLAKQLPAVDSSEANPAIISPEVADTVVEISPNGTLSPATRFALPGAQSDRLAKALVDSGVHYAGVPTNGPVRWRFLSEFPEPVFALRPGGQISPEGSSILLVKTRRRLLEAIGTFYSRALDSQSSPRIVDENGEALPLAREGMARANSGEVVAETLLPPPLPTWRVQLFSSDTVLIDGSAREQIKLYAWMVGGMMVVTVTIAILAGSQLGRRIALQEMRSDVLAVVSHEMKTPLASTRLFIDTLLERRYHGGLAQAEEYLRLIARENLRLERLAESFLTLSRFDKHPGRHGGLRIVPVPLDEVMLAAVERLRPQLEAPGCQFKLELSKADVFIPADLEAVTTVLVNLLENALKYTGDDKQISFRGFVADGRACYEVSDNGLGIDPDEQGRIFQRFYQSDRRLARSHDGCGLGLSLVQSIVRAHGGTVAVRSEPGKGSTFTVRLPLEKGTSAK